QGRSWSVLFEHVTQVETDHRWREVGRMQPHDLRAVRSLGQEIVEGTNEVRYLGAFVEGILARSEDMALQIYGAIAERQNRRDRDGITVLDLNPFECRFRLLKIAILRQTYTQHLLALMSFDTLHLQVA